MTAALLLILTGALQFVSHEVDGIDVGRANPLTGEVPLNYRQTDFNGDGFTDLLLYDRILLQRTREFPAVLSMGLPSPDAWREFDVWGDQLYSRHAGRLEIFKLVDMRWKRESRQSIDWPDLRGTDEPSYAELAMPTRYLYDISGDGVPEIVVPTPEGIYLFMRTGSTYTPAGKLDVFPQRKVLLPEGISIWPPRERRLGLPTTYLGSRLFLDSDRITVLSQSFSADAGVVHRAVQWRMEVQGGSLVATKYGALQETPPMPAFMQPCRLNSDATQDYAGVQSVFTEHALLPEHVFEIVATTDGGKTLQRFRTKSFPSLTAFTDLDGDGDQDMIVESTGLYAGGPREYIARSLSERRVRHALRLHLQDSSGKFSERASATFNVTIQLSRAPLRNGPLFKQYRTGALVNLTGDVNGDGLRDLVVRTHPDRLGIFLGNGSSFSKRPDATVSVELETRFALTDVDGDGLSDIVVQDDVDGVSRAKATVHFAIGGVR